MATSFKNTGIAMTGKDKTGALKPHFERTRLNRQFVRAAQSDDFARLKELHAEGAGINAIGDRGRNALSHASECGDGEMTDWLVAGGISADHPGNEGNTPLHYAVWGESDYCVKVIAGATSIHDAKNMYGETPAFLAVTQGTPDMVENIIRAGADPNQRNRDDTPLVVIAEAARSFDNVAVLLALGADPDLSGRSGETLALTAARVGDWSRARELVENGADVSVSNIRGDTLIDLARKGGRQDVVAAVIERHRPELARGTSKRMVKRKPISFG
jgi:ankyrin repeat protein